jgi:DNA polymerase-3 subunit delta'
VMTAAREAGATAEAKVTAETAAAIERIGAGRESTRERNRVKRAGELQAKRRRRRSETDEVRVVVDAVTGYWRDVLVAAVGAPEAVVSSDRLDEIALLAERFGEEGAGVVLEHAREVRRSLELPVTPSLALERLFHSVALGVRGTLIL